MMLKSKFLIIIFSFLYISCKKNLNTSIEEDILLINDYNYEYLLTNNEKINNQKSIVVVGLGTEKLKRVLNLIIINNKETIESLSINETTEINQTTINLINSLVKLKKLSINNSEMESAFFNLSELEYLDLSNNNLVNIDGNFNKLVHVKLLNNKFKTIDKSILKLDKIKYIDLSFNLIEKVNINQLNIPPSIVEVNIFKNKLPEKTIDSLNLIFPEIFNNKYQIK